MDTAPTTLEIRGARPGDAEAIAAMQALPGFRHGTLRLPHPSPEETRRWLEGPLDGRVLLALFDGQPVGMIDVHRYPGRRSHAGGIGLGVHDAWTGRGIGTAMMAEIVSYAENWLGLRRLELNVFTDNARAIALYRKFYFAVEGTLRGYALRDGAFVDAYAMARLRL